MFKSNIFLKLVSFAELLTSQLPIFGTETLSGADILESSMSQTSSSRPSQSTTMTASGLSSWKEKEYQLKLEHMAELLNEAEVQVQRMMDQEKILKEEIRKIDRSEKRKDLNIEYLKNIVLKFYESDEKEPLIPVMASVLHLSPEEIQRLKKALPTLSQEGQTGIIGYFGL